MHSVGEGNLGAHHRCPHHLEEGQTPMEAIDDGHHHAGLPHHHHRHPHRFGGIFAPSIGGLPIVIVLAGLFFVLLLMIVTNMYAYAGSSAAHDAQIHQLTTASGGGGTTDISPHHHQKSKNDPGVEEAARTHRGGAGEPKEEKGHRFDPQEREGNVHVHQADKKEEENNGEEAQHQSRGGGGPAVDGGDATPKKQKGDAHHRGRHPAHGTSPRHRATGGDEHPHWLGHAHHEAAVHHQDQHQGHGHDEHPRRQRRHHRAGGGGAEQPQQQDGGGEAADKKAVEERLEDAKDRKAHHRHHEQPPHGHAHAHGRHGGADEHHHHNHDHAQKGRVEHHRDGRRRQHGDKHRHQRYREEEEAKDRKETPDSGDQGAQQEENEQQQQKLRFSDGHRPLLILHTDYGAITIRLEPEAAPKTVALMLENAKQGFFNHSAGCFYRYEKGFVLQGGVCGGGGGKWRKKTVPLEYKLPNEKHSVALARTSDPHSGGTEFFINLRNNTGSLGPQRKGGYAVFGQVISGFETIAALKKLPVVAKKGQLTKFVKSPYIKSVEVQ